MESGKRGMRLVQGSERERKGECGKRREIEKERVCVLS